jgi:prephenate dehydrogenase
MKTLAESRVAVVGLGLMGGSLAGALRGHCAEVVGIDPDRAAIAAGTARGLINWGAVDLAMGVQEADVVILATPVRTILKLIWEMGPMLCPGTLLLDLGSTKQQIVEAMEALPPVIHALGGHPMCGKESSGIGAADPELYQGKRFILCPLSRTTEETLARGEELVRAVGAIPLVLEAQRQDRLTATISHLPYLLACGLTAVAAEGQAADPLLREVVASGFRDTSRLAGSDVTMMRDILLTNRAEVLPALARAVDQLQTLGALIEQDDEGALQKLLAEIREQRRSLLE